jgi:hypothetical protein
MSYLRKNAKPNTVVVAQQKAVLFNAMIMEFNEEPVYGGPKILVSNLEGPFPDIPAEMRPLTYFVTDSSKLEASEFEKANPDLGLRAEFSKPNDVTSFRVYSYRSGS